jgi:glycine cleavage system aminomethyltransferase T
MEQGARVGAVAYGTETMHVLRAEKGYIIIGQDTDGHGDADRRRARMGDRQGQARLRRQTLARTRRHTLAGSQAAGRAAER